MVQKVLCARISRCRPTMIASCQVSVRYPPSPLEPGSSGLISTPWLLRGCRRIVIRGLHLGDRFPQFCSHKLDEGATGMSATERQLAHKLGDAASSIRGVFCCGGSFPAPGGGISLWFNNKAGNASQLKLPMADQTTMQQLAECCEEDQLEAESFGTNLDLGKTSILDDVLASLGTCTQIRVEQDTHVPTLAASSNLMQAISPQLEKLSIHRPGRGLASPEPQQVDANLLGSLIVCLPHPQRSCQLHVKHSGMTQVFDWGNVNRGDVHWAAFFSSCGVEVTSGHGLTITYKLFRGHRAGTGVEFPPLSGHYPLDCRCCGDENEDYPFPIHDDAWRTKQFHWKYLASARVLDYFPGGKNSHLDPRSLPLYQVLCQAKDDPSFFPEGCTLAFGCQHYYLETDEIPAKEQDERAVLKGADAVLFSAASCAGLKPSLARLFKNGPGEVWEKFDEAPRVMSRQEVVIGKSMCTPPPDKIGQFDMKEHKLDPSWYFREKDAKVVWCTREQDWMLRGSSRHLSHAGGSYYDWVWYTGAAIMLHLPPWEVRSKTSRLDRASSDDTGL